MFNFRRKPKWELVMQLWADSIGEPIRIRPRHITWSTDHEWFQRRVNRILTSRSAKNTFSGKKFRYKVETEEHRGMAPRSGTEITVYRQRK